MRLTKHIKIVLFIFLPVMAVSFLIFLASVNKLQISAKNITVRSLSIDSSGQKYNIINGEVFLGDKKISPFFNFVTYKKVNSLGAFYQKTKEDPLFAGPGLNAEEFNKALESTKKSHDQFLSKVGLKDNVIPLDFLSNIGKVSSLKENFFKDPSHKNAESLLNGYSAALSGYRGRR